MPRLLVIFLLLPSPALAHDWITSKFTKIDASWILKQQPWCCGKRDCMPVGKRLRFTAQGWSVDGWKGHIRMGATYRSVDRQPWACVNLRTNAIRCLFLPDTGG